MSGHREIVAGRSFDSRSALASEAKRILYAATPGERITGADGDFVRALLDRHPDVAEKTARAIDHLTTQANIYGTVSFRIVYVDGSTDDFSIGKCVHQPRVRKSKR